jgi:hypothetical protein
MVAILVAVLTASAVPASATPPGWTREASPDAPGALVTIFEGDSCTSAPSCVAVGFTGSAAPYSPVAEHWNGKTWTLHTVPGTPGVSAVLVQVSCQGTRFCMAVGTGGGLDLAERWDGTAWTKVPTPTVAGATTDALTGIQCSGPDWCMAVGAVETPTYRSVTELWNGTSWSIVPVTPAPGGVANVLTTVSCLGRSFCTAVGFIRSGAGNTYRDLIMEWNGASWTTRTAPNPSAAFDEFLGVSCVSPTWCVAVGEDTVASHPQTLAMVGIGATWTVTPSPDISTTFQNNFTSVSCLSRVNCVGVAWGGGIPADGGAIQTLSEQWNGTSWSIVPSPIGSGGSQFNSVSCVAGDACTAVGNITGATTSDTLAMTLPETTPGYRMVASDGGVFAFGGAGFSGSMGGHPLNQTIVAMADTRDAKGY